MTTYSAYAIVDGKRIEVKSAKSYPDALAQLKAKIDEYKKTKGAKR